jgi:hypothetical protein
MRWSAADTRDAASDSVGAVDGLDDTAGADGRVVPSAEEFPREEHATTIANVTQTPAETRSAGVAVKPSIHARACAREAVARRPDPFTVPCPSMFSP